MPASIDLGDEIPTLQRRLIVVFSLVRALWQLDLLVFGLLVRDRLQNMRDDVEACPSFVIGVHQAPWRVLAVGRVQHHVARFGIRVPSPIGFDVHRAQLPLPQRILDARLESLFLLFLPYLQPDLDQNDAAIDDVFLDLWAELEEALMLVQKPMTHSTPARLYQLRSKMTISPPEGNCW